MLQTASAAMDDGLVDVMVVPVISLFRILREAHRLFDGTVPQSKYLVYRQCREITVAPLDPHSADVVEVDGEIEGRLPVTISATGQRIGIVAMQE